MFPIKLFLDESKMKKAEIVSLTLAFLMCVSLLFIPLFNREAEVTSTEQLQMVCTHITQEI